MPNDANVRAIAEAIAAYLDYKAEGGRHYIDLSWMDMDEAGTGEGGIDHLARFLASRGCLVPSALTDRECSTAINDGEDIHWFDQDLEEHPDQFRQSLERIARGDPT